MNEENDVSGMEKFRGKLQEFYWLIIWIFWIFIGLAYDLLDLDPSWAGWILSILGIIGAISKIITMIRNSPIFILTEARTNFCLAAILGLLFLNNLGMGSEVIWAIGAFAVLAVFLGVAGLKKYNAS